MARFFYLLFSFEGRIGRLRFLLGSLASVVIVVASAMAIGFVLAVVQGGVRPDETQIALWVTPVMLLSAWSTLALSAKRLHDRDMSGWWYLITLVPLVGALWWLVQTFLLPGTSGSNSYGPLPSAGGRGGYDADDSVPRFEASADRTPRAARPSAPVQVVARTAPNYGGGQRKTFGRLGL